MQNPLGAVNIMRSQLRGTVVGLVTAIILAVPAAGGAAPRHQVKMPATYPEWSRVALCEEGRTYHGRQVIWWVGIGTTSSGYPDPLGINAHNWEQFGGGPAEVPGPATRAEIIHAINVGNRLIKYYHARIPDQGGCAAW